MFPEDIIYEISKYAHRLSLLNLLSTCKLYKGYEHIYYDKYALNLKCKLSKLDAIKYSVIRNIVPKCTKVIYNIKDNSCSVIFLRSDKITWLSFGDKYDDELINIPRNVKVLKVGNKYNKPFTSTVTNYRNDIYRGDGYKIHQTIRNHISFYKLTTLVLGKRFNQAVDGLLPPTLKRLFLTGDFDQSVDNLPLGLEILHLSKKFDHSVDNLPPNLIELIFCKEFKHSIDKLPDSIKILKRKCTPYYYSSNMYDSIINKLPNNLEEFSWNWWYGGQNRGQTKLNAKLPPKIKKLELINPNIQAEQFLEWLGNVSRFETLHIKNTKSLEKPTILQYDAKTQTLKNILYNWQGLLQNNLDLVTRIKILHTSCVVETKDTGNLTSDELGLFVELESLHTQNIENIDKIPQQLKHLTVDNIGTFTAFGYVDAHTQTGIYNPITRIPSELKTLVLVGNHPIEYFPQLESLTIVDHPILYTIIFPNRTKNIKTLYKQNLTIISSHDARKIYDYW